MALVTERTPAKVNSSAITARQPEVPNRMVITRFFKELLNRLCAFGHKILGTMLTKTPIECVLVMANPLPINTLGGRLAECSTSA